MTLLHRNIKKSSQKRSAVRFFINNIMKNASLYWIRLSDHTDITSEGYVGVSQDYKKRFAQHLKECKNNTHSNPHLLHAYNKYGKESFVIEEIYFGTENECYAKECELRPKTKIGWNVAFGGHRGPGRVKGSIAQQLVNDKNREKRKQRDERIASGNPTEEDLVLIEKKREKSLLIKLVRDERDKSKKMAMEKQRLAKKLAREAQKLAKKQSKEKKKPERLRDSDGALIEPPTRPICNHCKFSLAKTNGKSKHGFQQWHKYCIDCAKALYSDKFKHLANKQLTCEKCGFIPEDRCQLDLVNKNGNKKDKSKTNLLTVCANCARLHNKQTRIQRKSILNVSVDSDIRIC